MVTPLVSSPRVQPAPLLSGQVPVRVVQRDGFVGTMEQDGQVVHVTAIAFDQNQMVFVSLVGRDTSVSAVLAQLWKKKDVVFRPEERMQWKLAEMLVKRNENQPYKQFSTPIAAFKMTHTIAMLLSAHLGEGVATAPSMGASTRPEHRVPQPNPRYVLGNASEETPHALSFLGHLRAMRVVLLSRDEKHPDYPVLWASHLWYAGLRRKLIVPLRALGVQVWLVQPEVEQWNRLVLQGIQDGSLPWTRPIW